MKKQKLEPAVCVFSVDRYDRPAYANKRFRLWAEDYMKRHGVPYSLASGHYNGSDEQSYVVLAKYGEDVRFMTTHSDQDCFLYLEPDRAAYLIDPEYNREHIGQWVHSWNKPDGDYTYYSGHYFEVV